MKHLVSLLLVLCLLCAHCAALASGLPDISGANAASGLPDLSGGEAAKVSLPNPGSYYGSEETLFQEDFAYTDGNTYQVYTFPLVEGLGDMTSEFLRECEDRQFAWTVEKIGDVTAYRITGAAGQAILAPNYQGMIMLMKEPELEMDAAVIQAPEDLALGEYRVMYNGRLLKTDSDDSGNGLNGHYYGCYTMNLYTKVDDPGLITLRFPEDLRTGDKIEIRKGGYDSRILMFSINSLGSIPVWNGRIDTSGKQDYFTMEVLYADENRIRFTFEGSFNDGATTISGEAYFKTP